MNWLHAVILGIVEGITEFLPVSSTGHLNIVEKLLHYDIDSVGMTAFTAVIQVGAILAAVVYFWGDIVRIVTAWFKGLANAEARTDPDYTLGWGIILGSIPVAVVGLLFKDFIEVTARSLWVIAGALILWSGVMWLADRRSDGPSDAAHASAGKGMREVSIKDALIIGGFQALAPVFPGISRSGATISAGLFLRFDRVTATRLSFFMGIPALLAAGALEAVTAAGDISATVGWSATLIATVVSGLVAYATIAWLLRFVSSNKFTGFLVYRVLLGLVIIVLVATGTVAA
ncbi:undecaprenyl-diphosphate phosphatase [Actinomyces ruminis]|uniref:Undecaprenyl-diphosphatase n=1 Tax=Actinomyces ruminis TaxID=1937003 RepID=A0ABX4M958_9ACTO|nr:undecaprenyl-diphosphate phosphatase [Actinomyces ruminis]PHP51836.1 undecaprenyl-diphosphate phosphatase [Actinomyces ruminis]